MSVSVTATLGVGMLTVEAPSGTGGTPAAVTEGGDEADMRRASNRLVLRQEPRDPDPGASIAVDLVRGQSR